MAFIKHQGRVIQYRLLGNRDKPLLVMAHPLGMTQGVWDDLLPVLLEEFRVLNWDLPGHGGSEAWPADKPITPEDLAAETLMLCEVADTRAFHFVGTSIGGVIGQQLLKAHGERLLSLTLTNTGAVIGTPAAWQDRANRVRTEGLARVGTDIVPRWFSANAMDAQSALGDGWIQQIARCDDNSYALLCEMLGRADFRGELPRGTCDIKLIGGSDDLATPPTSLEALRAELGGLPITIMPGVGHVPSIEQPQAFLAALLAGRR